MAVVTIPYRTRKDGVKLVKTIDGVFKPIYDENGNEIDRELIPRGFYILQNETQVKYAEAIDVENAPYTYSETDEKIEQGDENDEDRLETQTDIS